MQYCLKHVAAAPIFLAAAVMAAPPASAGDWSFSGNISDRIDLFDNYKLKHKSEGFVVRDSIGVLGDLAYTTHDSKFDLIGQIVADGFTGPGSRNLNNDIFPTLAAKYHLDQKLTSYDFGIKYAYVFIPAVEAFNDENQFVVVEDASARHSLNANFGIQHKIDRLTSVSYTSAITDNMYTGAGIDNFTWDNTAALKRQLTKLVSGNASVGFKWLTQSDAANTDSFVISGNLGLSAQLTKRLNGSISGGANLVTTRKNNLLLPGHPRQSTSNAGFQANAGLSYAFKTGSIGFNTNYGVQQTTQGILQNSYSLGLTASKTLNETSSLAFAANAQFTRAVGNSGGGTLARYAFGPTYSLKLDKDWQFLAGYNFVLKDDAGAKATSQNGFVSLTRNFAVK